MLVLKERIKSERKKHIKKHMAQKRVHGERTTGWEWEEEKVLRDCERGSWVSVCIRII